MPAPRWASHSQLAFLTSRLPVFSKSQEEKTLPTFWSETYREFFLRWPDPAAEALSGQADDDASDSGAKQKAKKKKKNNGSKENNTASSVAALPLEEWVTLRRTSVYNWYNNHNLNKGTRRVGKINTVTVVLQPSVSRVSSEHHLYSKRYYESRVKADVDKEIGDQKIEPGKKIAIINKHLQEKYSNESEDIKNEIREAIEQERKEKIAEKETYEAIANGTGELTAKQYMAAQSAAPDMIKDFMESLSKRTGWSFSMLAGGPSPELGGAIRTIALHSGINVHGLSYAKFHPNNHKKFVAPYNSFLKTVYPSAPNDKRFMLESTKESNIESNKKDSNLKGLDEKNGEARRTNVDSEDSVIKDGTREMEGSGMGVIGVGEVGKQVTVTKEKRTEERTSGLSGTTILPSLSNDRVNDATAIDKTGYVFNTSMPSVLQQVAYQQSASQSTFGSVPLNSTTAPVIATSINTSMLSVPQQLSYQQSVPQSTIGSDALNTTAIPALATGVPWNADVMNDAVFDPEVVARTISPEDWAAIDDFIRGPISGGVPSLNPNNGQNTMKALPTTGFTTSSNTAITNLGVSVPPTLPTSGLSTSSSAGMTNLGVPLPPFSGNGSGNDTMVNQTAGVHPLFLPIQNLTIPPPEGVPGGGLPTLYLSNEPKESSNAANAPKNDISVAGGDGEDQTGEENTKNNTEAAATGRTRRSATAKKEVSPWLAAAKEYLEEAITDEIWETCLQSWMAFENEISISDVSAHRLPVRLRPPVLSKWMSTRKYAKIPEIENKVFSNEWLKWWNGIQPEWRQSDGPGLVPSPLDHTEARDISCIRKGGPSGLVTVLTGLKWWAEDPATKDLWLAAVEDVNMCFEVMKTNAGGIGQKRKANPDNGGKGKAKPKAKKQKI